MHDDTQKLQLPTSRGPASNTRFAFVAQKSATADRQGRSSLDLVEQSTHTISLAGRAEP